jgi:hypothetical protein
MFNGQMTPKEFNMTHTPQTLYYKGDLARYTGSTVVLHGGLFYEIELLEGHMKGQIVVTQRAPEGV